MRQWPLFFFGIYLVGKRTSRGGRSPAILTIWKDVTAGHESIGPNLILLETEVKNYMATSGLTVTLGLRPHTISESGAYLPLLN